MQSESVKTAMAALVVLGVAGSVQAESILDPFQATQTLEVDAGSQHASGSVTGNMLGGERDTTLEWTDGTGGAVPSDILWLTNPTGEGRGIYATSFDAMGTVTMDYDGGDGDPSTLDIDGLGGIDLTHDGNSNGFGVDMLFNDQPWTMNFEVWSLDEGDGPRMASGELEIPTVVAGSGGERFTLPFADFTGDDADFTNVGAVRVRFDAPAGLDMGMEEIVTTPTPSAVSAGLAMMGMLAAYRRGRRRHEHT